MSRSKQPTIVSLAGKGQPIAGVSGGASAQKRMLTPAEEMEKYGIVCIPVNSYHYGGYRYSNLKDAIAQAKRG